MPKVPDYLIKYDSGSTLKNGESQPNSAIKSVYESVYDEPRSSLLRVESEEKNGLSVDFGIDKVMPQVE